MEQRKFETDQMRNCLLPVVSGSDKENSLHIHQDTTFYMSVLDANQSLSYEAKIGRRTYFYLIDGEVVLDHNFTLRLGDAAQITDIDLLTIQANQDSKLLIIDLP